MFLQGLGCCWCPCKENYDVNIQAEAGTNSSSLPCLSTVCSLALWFLYVLVAWLVRARVASCRLAPNMFACRAELL